MTIAELFNGINLPLENALDALRRRIPAKTIAKQHIEPVIDHISANAGQPMDPLYVTYLIQHAFNVELCKRRIKYK